MDTKRVKDAARTGGLIGKQVIIEGVRVVLLGAITVSVSTLFNEGTAGLKKLTFEQFLRIKIKPENKVIEEVVVLENKDEEV